MHTAKVTSKGQITIPKRIRSLMAIETGDRLAFDLDGDGGLHVHRVRSRDRPLRGLLSEYAKDERVEEGRIREALRQRTAAKYALR